jgi:hypothetical protein
MDDLNRHLKELLQDPKFEKAWQESEQEYREEKKQITSRLKRKNGIRGRSRKLAVANSRKS